MCFSQHVSMTMQSCILTWPLHLLGCLTLWSIYYTAGSISLRVILWMKGKRAKDDIGLMHRCLFSRGALDLIRTSAWHHPGVLLAEQQALPTLSPPARPSSNSYTPRALPLTNFRTSSGTFGCQVYLLQEPKNARRVIPVLPSRRHVKNPEPLCLAQPRTDFCALSMNYSSTLSITSTTRTLFVAFPRHARGSKVSLNPTSGGN